MENVTIVLADADVDRRIELKKMLFENSDMDVVGETETPDETIETVDEETPELLLLSYPLEDPDQTRNLVEELTVENPQLEILLIAEDMEESENARKLQRFGVRDTLVRPIESNELLDVIQDVINVSRRKKEKLTEMVTGESVSSDKRAGKLISVFSTKGGVGRSLLATNLACMIRELTDKKVALIDLDLQFGDDAIMLDMTPTTAIGSLARDCEEESRIEYDLLERYLHTHEESGVDLIAAPPRPEEADYVQADATQKILDALKRFYHYVIVDTSSQVTEPVISSLENSDLILLLLTLELPTIKDGKLMLELIDDLGLSRDKVQIVMNRNKAGSEIELQEVEEALEQEVLGGLPSEGNLVMPSVNEGRPIVLSHPQADFSSQLRTLTRTLIADKLELEDELEVEESESTSSAQVDLPLASIGSRATAGLIDYSLAYMVGWGMFILLGVMSSVFMEGSTGTLIGVLLGAVGSLVPIGYFALSGEQSLGKQVMDLKIADQHGEPPEFGTILIRSVMAFFGFLLVGIGLIWTLLNQNRQGLHDLIADTYVISTGSASDTN
jgi:pilus assembly protein CpaE